MRISFSFLLIFCQACASTQTGSLVAFPEANGNRRSASSAVEVSQEGLRSLTKAKAQPLGKVHVERVVGEDKMPTYIWLNETEESAAPNQRTRDAIHLAKQGATHFVVTERSRRTQNGPASDLRYPVYIKEQWLAFRVPTAQWSQLPKSLQPVRYRPRKTKGK